MAKGPTNQQNKVTIINQASCQVLKIEPANPGSQQALAQQGHISEIIQVRARGLTEGKNNVNNNGYHSISTLCLALF